MRYLLFLAGVDMVGALDQTCVYRGRAGGASLYRQEHIRGASLLRTEEGQDSAVDLGYGSRLVN
jgi:hypothetical protein